MMSCAAFSSRLILPKVVRTQRRADRERASAEFRTPICCAANVRRDSLPCPSPSSTPKATRALVRYFELLGLRIVVTASQPYLDSKSISSPSSQTDSMLEGKGSTLSPSGEDSSMKDAGSPTRKGKWTTRGRGPKVLQDPVGDPARRLLIASDPE